MYHHFESQHLISILFVHGLRGRRLNTWTKGSRSWPRDILANVVAGKSDDSKTSFLLVFQVRTAILTVATQFGYDSSVVQLAAATSQNSVFGHAENLLLDLKNERRTVDARKRPLIFVGHSLGGLVIKQVYRISIFSRRTAAITYGFRP